MKRLLFAAAVLGLAALAMKKCSKQRDQWHGLSETDAREKLDRRLPSRIPDERRAAMTDKIIGQMRDRGVIVDEADDEEAGKFDIDLTTQPREAAEDIPTTKV